MTSVYYLNQSPAVLRASLANDLSQSGLGAILNPQTPAEAAAGVVPVNLAIPNHVSTGGVFIVERYGNNTTPGTTDMSGAFTTAVKVAQRVGGIVTYVSSQLLLLNSINCTFGGSGNQKGVIIQGPDSTVDVSPLSAPAAILVAKHTQNSIFCCVGNDSIKFRDVSMTTDPTTYPKSGILTARNTAAGSLFFRAENCKIVGHFSAANIYNYGAEDDTLRECSLTNYVAGTALEWITANNIGGLASDFATDNFGNVVAIATGTQSTIEHNRFAMVWNHQGGAGSDCVRGEQADSFKSYGGVAINGSGSANGRAIFYVDMTNAASNFWSVDGLTCDNTTFQSQYLLAFSNHVQAPSGFSLRNIRSVCATNVVAALGTNPTIDSFRYDNIIELATRGCSFPGTLRNSTVSTYATLTIGTSTNNNLQGDSTAWTITTTNGGSKTHTGSSLTFAPGIVSGVNGWTAVGAITQRSQYTYIGNMVYFSIQLSAATTIACSAGATIPTLPVTAGVTNDQSCQVVDTSTHTSTGAKIYGTTITMPSISATADEIIISGSYFVT